MRITCVFLGSTSASAIYSFQMISALVQRNDCELQIVISKNVYNLDDWLLLRDKEKCEMVVVETYRHSPLHLMLSYLNVPKIYKLSQQILKFAPQYVYVPFGCVWGPILYPLLYRKTKIVDTIHDPHLHDTPQHFFENCFYKINRWAINFTSGIVILNEKDCDYVKERYKKPVSIIPHAAFSYYTQYYSNQICDDIKYQIAFVGRIEPYKGLDILIGAFEKLKIKNIKLLIAGGGTISEELKTRILTNTKIELFNRFISDEEMVNIVLSSDCIVLPYLRASQSGVIPMAFALGKPVIATNVGSLEQQVPAGTGIVTDPNEVSVGAAIEDFYRHPNLIKEYGIRAKEYADRELTWDISAKKIVGFLETIR